jgi:hypothetical protein
MELIEGGHHIKRGWLGEEGGLFQSVENSETIGTILTKSTVVIFYTK